MCGPLQDYAQEECGCGEYNPHCIKDKSKCFHQHQQHYQQSEESSSSKDEENEIEEEKVLTTTRKVSTTSIGWSLYLLILTMAIFFIVFVWFFHKRILLAGPFQIDEFNVDGSTTIPPTAVAAPYVTDSETIIGGRLV